MNLSQLKNILISYHLSEGLLVPSKSSCLWGPVGMFPVSRKSLLPMGSECLWGHFPFPLPRKTRNKRASCCYILQGFTYLNNLQKLLDGNYNAMNTTGFLQFRRTISVNEILGMALLLLWFTSGQPQSVFLQVRGILWNGDSARAFSQDPWPKLRQNHFPGTVLTHSWLLFLCTITVT